MADKRIQNNYYINLLNDKLPELRKTAKVSQSDMAKSINVARTTYTMIESKQRNMTIPVFTRLTKYFSENKNTKKLLQSWGFTEDVLRHFYQIEFLTDNLPARKNVTRVAAFGGNITSEENNKKHREIEKALKEIKNGKSNENGCA